MSRISSIGKEDVHRITSGQVIVDLCTAVKELVENSIDAHSKKIEVTFKNYGIDSIEVSDDGDGIDEQDFDKIALKHYTSKLSTFEDVAKVKTLGFRGEAMSSLCAISNVKITTTKKAPKATTLEFKHSGEVGNKTICSRPKGTSIIITDLFNNLPVRKKDFIKNSKKEFSKCLTLLQSYALISTNVKILVYNMTPKGKKNIVLSSQGNDSMKNNIINVFGSNGLYGLIPIELELDLNTHKSRLKILDHSTDYTIKVSGYISKCSFGFGRSATDRQVFFINYRPVSLQPFAKAINEIYKTFNHIQYPVILLNLELDPQFIDVNVTPDKRTVLIHNENRVIEELKEKLAEFYDSQDLSMAKNSQTQRSLGDLRSSSYREDDEEEVPVQSSLNTSSFAYTPNIKSEIDPPSDEIQGKKRILTSDGNETKRRKREEIVEKDQEDIDEREQSEELAETSKELIEDDENDGEKSAAEEVEEENQETQPKSSTTRESILSTFRNRPGIRSKPAELPILKNLSSFRNDQNIKKPQSKQTTLEPVLMQIGDQEMVQEAYIRKNGKLTFKECHCGSQEHTKEFHNYDDPDEIEIDGEDAVEDAEEDADEGSAKDDQLEDEENLEGEVNDDGQISSDDGSVYQEDDDLEPVAEEPPEPISIKKEFNNKFLISSEREKDAARNYEQYLTFTTCSDTICESIDQPQDSLKSVSIDNIDDQEESENKLTLTVSKKDFMDMKIIGQFNLGFILVIRQNESSQDLFIVDQHASDEKYNFETLQKVTVFDSQPLVAPKFIELNALDELVVIDHKEVFIKNGFKFTIDEEGEPGARIKLVSLPISKKTVFDESDFNELIHLVKENQGNTNSVRCSKIRSMFAMRACRKSIMVGRSLTTKTMTKVVRNLGELDKPWVSINQYQV